MPAHAKTPTEALLGHVSYEPNGCWQWRAFVDKQGYGQMYTEGKKQLPHRVAYRIFKGNIPDGMQIDHLCRNRSCVNPDHLEAVTPRENSVVRAIGSIGAIAAAKTTCQYGHEFTEVETRRGNKIKKRRSCVTCRIAASKRQDVKRKAARAAKREAA